MSQKYQSKIKSGQESSTEYDSGLSEFEDISTDAEIPLTDQVLSRTNSIIFDNSYSDNNKDTEALAASIRSLRVRNKKQPVLNYSDDETDEEGDFEQREETPTPETIPSPRPSTSGGLVLDEAQAKLFFDMLEQFKKTNLKTATSRSAPEVLTATHRTNVGKVNNLIDSNMIEITSDPKGFGLRFLSLCIACAFGGRKGFERYQRDLFNDISFQPMLAKLRGCINHQGGLNVAVCCYVGHVIIYYWNNEDVRNALIRKYGAGLNRVIRGDDNIRKEIGGVNLWSENRSRVSSVKKRDIIDDIAERKFQFDEASMKAVMDKLGIDVD
ncbi:hypothetical protein WICPIJ_008999 [Wickerhamomyces pijperi]|uniref:Uncharacterized protein n=1 Tax=Wickerhamomyces pijperi TaxID=599730 RepID=A0A9P8TFW2_WICPI|nr:hypothetical protein WICPIJ_008999 [Wickerhamomyces pijperi]